METPTKLYIISGTHWDREWYQDFQHYRFRLVRMIDDLIENMEKDERYKVFHMDGQTIVLRDYLEIRPENRARLEKLIQDGRIVIGPWYVMPDEFLIGGESLIKNLQIGHEICREFGAAPLNDGYVPDIFGHNSQFPQILKGFNINSALLFRGIADYEKDTFVWRSPDGSEVYAIKLDKERSYSNFYFAVRWPYEISGFDEKDAVARMKSLLEYSKTMGATNLYVMMDGVDHIDMDPRIPDMVELFEKNIPGVEFHHANLGEYVEELEKASPRLDVIEGALYHIAKTGVNNGLLKNVLSSTVPLKQKNDLCENLLTRFAEPVNAFYDMASGSLRPKTINDYDACPRRSYLDKAWDFLIQNQPHDSICGCSTSDVHRDNEYRFRQSEQISEIMTDDALSNLVPSIHVQEQGADGNVLLFNPSQQAYKKPFVTTIYVRSAKEHNLRFYDAQGRETRVQLLQKKNLQIPNHKLRKLITFDSMEEWTAAVETEVPALGYTVLSYDDIKSRDIENYSYGFVDMHYPKRLTGSLKTGRNTFNNGIYELTVNANGTIKVKNLATGRVFDELLTFEDSADAGNGWNYEKAAFDSVYYGTAGIVEYALESDGPLACVIKIIRTFRLPAGLGDDAQTRSSETVEQTFTTRVTLLKDNPVISIHTEIDNKAADHRLRVLFPTGLKTDSFYTKLPFDMYRWPITAEPYSESKEEESFVHPSQGITFMEDGRDTFSVYSKGLYEVEVSDDGEHSVALTLFRSPAHETGAETPDYTKLFQKLSFDYAISFADADSAEAFIEGEKWRAGLYSSHFAGEYTGSLPSSRSFLTINAKTTALSFVRLVDGSPNTYEIRLVEIAGRQDDVEIRFISGIRSAFYTNFLGENKGDAPFEGTSLKIKAEPHKIVTVRVTLE